MMYGSKVIIKKKDDDRVVAARYLPEGTYFFHDGMLGMILRQGKEEVEIVWWGDDDDIDIVKINKDSRVKVVDVKIEIIE